MKIVPISLLLIAISAIIFGNAWGSAPAPTQSASDSSSCSNTYRFDDKMTQAVQEGNIVSILEQLKQADKKGNNWPKKTFLKYVASNPQFIEQVKVYIDTHPEIMENPIDDEGETALITAFKELPINLTPLFFMLIEKTKNLNATNIEGNTPLLLACASEDQNNTKIVQKLLNHGASINIAGKKTGLTPLMLATEEGNVDTVALLLNRGADVNAATPEGWTALFFAGKPIIAALLLRKGANIEARSSIDFGYLTPFLHAIIQNNIDMVKFLARNGANVNAQDSKGIRAIHMIIQKRHQIMENKKGTQTNYNRNLAILKEILSYPDINVNIGYNIPSIAGIVTPLTLGVYFLDYQVVKLLLENGANINQVDDIGQTAYEILHNDLNLLNSKDIVKKRKAELIIDLLNRPYEKIEQQKAIDDSLFKTGKIKEQHLSKTVSEFLEGNADPKAILINEMKVLLRTNKIAELKELFAQYPQALELTDGYGDTILLQAIKDSKANIAQSIIEELWAVDENSKPENDDPETHTLRRDYFTKALEHTNTQGFNALTLAQHMAQSSAITAEQRDGLQCLIETIELMKSKELEKKEESNNTSIIAMPKDLEKDLIVANKAAIEKITSTLADNPKLLYSVDASGKTPLMLAALHGHYILAEQILTELAKQSNSDTRKTDMQKAYDLAKDEFEKEGERKNEYAQIMELLSQ